MTTSTLLAPTQLRITKDMLKAASRHRAGVVVLDEDSSTVYALAGGLTTGQANDARWCVLLTSDAVRGYLADADTDAEAARTATADIREALARGFL